MTDATTITDWSPPHGVRPMSVDWQRWLPYATVLIATFAIRGITFGNPMPDFDEQLYLLIGDRLLHGHLPYVELWDRKPIGLFLFYAFVRAFGGAGIIQYQVAATLCVAATSAMIVRMARRAAGPIAATVAGIAYILLLNPFHGTGGQSPVIYNVLTAAAALCAFSANDTDDPRRLTRLSIAAMAAMGAAIQFKYTPVVEGVFFGCYFLWRFVRSSASRPRIVSTAFAMILVALLPTILAIGVFAGTGHLDAFVQANFISVFQRNPFPADTHREQRIFVLVYGFVVITMVPVAIWRRWISSGASRDFILITGWSAAAAIGFGLLGEFYDFYFITVLLPLSVLVAPVLRTGRIGFAAGCLLLFWPIVTTPPYYFQRSIYRDVTAKLVAAIRPYVGPRCLYVYDGPTILYLLTNSCAPTRFIYPDHLTNPTEAPALGVDPIAEEARLLATRPGAIVTASRPVIPHVAPGTQRLVRDALARDYTLIAAVPSPDRTFYVWALRTLHRGPLGIHDPRAAIPY